jgi:hypothetical protein
MLRAGGPAGQALRDAVGAEALSPEPDADLAACAGALAAAGAGTLLGLVFFGSRRTGAARANAWSAYDLFAIVTGYGPFYRALRAAGLSGKSPRLLSAISPWLAPTQISIVFRDPALHAKVSVLTLDAFRRETSAGRRDHFTIGRLFQPARLLYARDAASRGAIVEGLAAAVAATWQWSQPWLSPAFDVDGYGRTTLEISMSWEIRPEPPGRAAALWQAQRGIQTPVLKALLGEVEAAGGLRRTESGDWQIVEQRSSLKRIRLSIYFSQSIVRSTLRWGKHILSFEGWLDYIVRKAGRHAGEPIELTDRERRWPLLFLWARVFRYLRDRRARRPGR